MFFRRCQTLILQAAGRCLSRRWEVLVCGLLLVGAASAEAQIQFPDLPFTKRSTDELTEVARAPSGPGDMCILPSGEHLISCHQFFMPEFRVMKLDKQGNWTPFPNVEMNTPGSGAVVELDSVIGIACDSRGIVWMLDNGRRGDTPPKLVGWDTKRNDYHKVIPISAQSLSPRSFLKNLALDPLASVIYISDPADGISSALIVVDTNTGICRRVLEGHRSVQRDPKINLILEDRDIEVRRPDGAIATPLTGVSALALDRKGEWLYFGPRNGDTLFKIKTELLRRFDINNQVLETQVLGVCPKPICDSIVIDARGRIYFGDISRGSIDYVAPEDDYLDLRLLIRDPRLLWPGGLNLGSDGYLHFFSNQLHRTSFFNGGKDVTAPPFPIFKTKPLTSGRFGGF